MNRNICSVRLLSNSHNIMYMPMYIYIYIAAAVTLDLASLRFKQHRVERHEVAAWLCVVVAKLSICMRSVRAFALYSTFGSHNSPYLFYVVFPSMWFFFFSNSKIFVVCDSVYVCGVSIGTSAVCIYTYIRRFTHIYTFISTINCRTAILWSLSPLTDTLKVSVHTAKRL